MRGRLVLAILAVLAAGGSAAAQESPRRGGELIFLVPAEPPSYDAHREESFAVVHPAAPHYNTLLRVDPTDRTGTRIVGDLAESWTVAADGRTYTVRIRRGVRFHDGGELTARDVKASYDKIIFPPPGVTSNRKGEYIAVETVTTPDPYTVVFRLKWPSASFLSSLASPFNWIYKADILARDIHWYEKNVMGTGPFLFVEYVKGSHWIGRRNPDYWDKGRPYLDGYRALFVRDSAAQVAAIRSQRAMIQFRGFSPPERDTLVQALGNAVTVQESPWECSNPLALNHERKPFDDRRVRRALSLALDRHQGAASLSRLTILREVAGVQGVGTPFATPPAELERLAGYSRDIAKSRAEARRLLREAGVPEGFAFTFKNRGIPNPTTRSGCGSSTSGDRPQRADRDARAGHALPRRVRWRLRGRGRLPLQLHRRAGPGPVQVPVDGREPDQLQPLRGPDARRALREAEPGRRPRGAPALHPRLRAAPAR